MKFNSSMLKIYLVGGTQDTHHSCTEFLHKVELAMNSGITAFQYREKGSSTLTDSQRLSIALKLRELSQYYHLPLIIDDDLTLALQCHADGIHIGQNDQQVKTVIQQAAKRLFIGYSCHTIAEIQHANQFSSISYIGAGPIFPTHSKDDAEPAIGLAQLNTLNQNSYHPVVAIGGINEQNMTATLQTGVAGLAVISMILNSTNLQQTIHHMQSLYH